MLIKTKNLRIQFSYFPIIIKFLPIGRLLIVIGLFGFLCTFKILFYIHKDIAVIIKENGNVNNMILDILMIDIQCCYMQTLCASLWMFVKLSKHFGYMNEWRFIIYTIIPQILILFIISMCPNLNIKYWWISLRIYTLINSIRALVTTDPYETSPYN